MATTPLRLQRCWSHETREAVSRCPECRRPFCRECVTEYQGRVLCAACLRLATQAPPATHRRLTGFWRTAGLLLGLLIGWWTVYSAGQLLLAIPAEYHEGATWAGR